jgi:hypothetical protein
VADENNFVVASFEIARLLFFDVFPVCSPAGPQAAGSKFVEILDLVPAPLLEFSEDFFETNAKSVCLNLVDVIFDCGVI